MFIEYAAILTGTVCLLAGSQFVVLRDSHLGIYLIGTGLALAGIEALWSREMSLIFSGETAPRHSGLPAVVWGLMLLGVGGAMIGYAYLTGAHLWPRVETTLARYPGLNYLAAGLLMIGFSIQLFVDSGRTRSLVQTFFFRVPRVMFAVVVLLGGIAVAAGGGWQLLDAHSFAASQRTARMQIEKTLEGHPAQGWFKKK